MGYFLSCVVTTTTGEFGVDLSNCSIDDYSCKFLIRGLSSCSIANHIVATAQLSIDLQDNRIHGAGAHCVAQVLTNNSSIRGLRLNSSIGESGLKSVAESIIQNTSLRQLSICKCSVKITEQNGLLLTGMLQRNRTLEVLELSDNDQVSDTGALFIAEGLKSNSSLRELKLNRCCIGDAGLQSLGCALAENDSLLELELMGNCMSERGVSALTEGLKRNQVLVKLSLPEHSTGSVDVQEEVNVARIRNGHSVITVVYC